MIDIVEILNVSSKDSIETNPEIDQRQNYIHVSGKYSLLLFHIPTLLLNNYLITNEISD